MLASASSSFLLSKAARHLITPSLRRFTRVPAVENPLRTFRTIPVFPISSSSGMEQQVASHPAAARAGFSASSAGGSVLTFQFSPLSVLKIQKGDITLWSVDGSTDAIVTWPHVLGLLKWNWPCRLSRYAGDGLLHRVLFSSTTKSYGFGSLACGICTGDLDLCAIC
ncbi:hypothetical protein ZIOFF_016109 [Zingiber officinale]|uniref:Uncharacterized protein n=1 Tax=Zingiber officinale TaxID=94328 RepID=A0A8J5I293_ZINOF|nr:hypothetical protein ZIOFF_016109 [Zingiber officinale]